MIKWIQKKKNQKGFTLVELVVVIAILGILAAIAVPRLMGFQDRAKAQADQQVASQVRNGVALLYANGEIKLAKDSEDLIFSLDNTEETPIADLKKGTLLTPDTIEKVGELIASKENGALISDYKIQNKSGRIIWVRLTTNGGVRAVLSEDEPADWDE